MIDHKLFFDGVRAEFGSLTQSQVNGFNSLLSVFEKDYGWPDLRWLAYCLATTWHETAATMQPIKEYGSQAYLQAKPYYPYFGRGYVQLTWEDNYRKMGNKIGLSLLGPNMDMALDPKVAAAVLFSGMRDGDFTGKALTDYFDSDTDDPKNARRIVNGTDKADLIAGYHWSFLRALSDATVEPIPPPPPPEPELPMPDMSQYILRSELAQYLRTLADLVEHGS